MVVSRKIWPGSQYLIITRTVADIIILWPRKTILRKFTIPLVVWWFKLTYFVLTLYKHPALLLIVHPLATGHPILLWLKTNKTSILSTDYTRLIKDVDSRLNNKQCSINFLNGRMVHSLPITLFFQIIVINQNHQLLLQDNGKFMYL